ncbi:FGGY-family carbohydrate kinase [Streptomyces lycii]|uniref:Carbohydrate kinase n=1 Tax=Streptomyces lycii TaxID=2654337 RepID=A0ABQ7FFA2_9ACTN|nr:FGGY family carbohydrate kinase [Streptomyces lycii]KAF4407709.1 carbohydrate kinase [Streptomyces lycii]
MAEPVTSPPVPPVPPAPPGATGATGVSRVPGEPSGVPVLAGLDLGSTRVKAVVCTADGSVLGSGARPTPLGEDDADALVSAALGALAEAVAAAGRPPLAVGLTGMAETGVPLAPDGRPAGPLLTWSDPRGTEQAARLVRTVGGPHLHAVTGVRPSAKATLAKWCWLREHRPEALERMGVWSGAADLVARALTGRTATDPTFAQRTMAYDVHRGRWDPELAALAGLSTARLPPVRAPGEPAGHVTGDGARRVPGLRTGTPVVVAGHDHLVGAWAAGARTAGAVADSMGTAEAVLTLSERPPEPAGALARGMGYGRHADGRHWYVMAGTGSCGALTDWCAELLGLPGGPERQRRFGALLAEAGGGPTGLVVEPYLSGRTAPAPDPDRRVAVHGLGPGDGPARLALAVVEATAYQARWMTEAQAELTGVPPDEVVLLGGPVAQTRWPGVKAAVTPWRTRVLAEHRAPAVGAALLAAPAAGLPVPGPLPTETREPGPGEDRERYDAVYREAFLPAVTRAAGPATAPGTAAAAGPATAAAPPRTGRPDPGRTARPGPARTAHPDPARTPNRSRP